ncbi:F-box/kelch-repeat protein At3g23880-like [Vicia villosa]|uniref:F-box/kelch-repeat protein At3g23880-like n=1 Tax=Vicia villosa TaxID=3911 RepID=UPI00273C9328|nr:F-box/kelch-repeat protein At3g23880-like [Vicia villosa]
MDPPPSQTRRPPSSPSSTPIIPDEIIVEVLSFLPVKSLIQMKCVSKFFKSLISDPTFIKMHLRRSARNPQLTIVSGKCVADFRFVTLAINDFLENPLIIVPEKPFLPLLDTVHYWLVGSCNGLLCFAHYSSFTDSYGDCWLNFYNPATNTLSNKLGHYKDYCKHHFFFSRYAFGYDCLTDNYKVAALQLIADDGEIGGENGDNETQWRTKVRTEVRVFSVGDNVWRDIQDFPVGPLRLTLPFENHGVYLNGNLSWLALRNCYSTDMFYHSNDITLDQFVIISLDLSAERHVELTPPQGLEEVPLIEPTISVLLESLCFCHDFKQTCLVIWQMKEFGVGESWTQLYRINYQNLQHIGCWLPLHISQDKNTLVLANKRDLLAIIYDWANNRVEMVTNKPRWAFCKDYVESLVSVR